MLNERRKLTKPTCKNENEKHVMKARLNESAENYGDIRSPNINESEKANETYSDARPSNVIICVHSIHCIGDPDNYLVLFP